MVKTRALLISLLDIQKNTIIQKKVDPSNEKLSWN